MMKHSSTSLLTWCLLSGLLLLTAMQAQTRIDPKTPDWQWFPAVDTLFGIREGPGRGAQFGREIHSVGDIDNSGTMDFVVNHLRTDTLFNGRPAIELLLYRGVTGSYPDGADGERIGLSEVGANVQFLAAGDFDGDTHRDIVVQARILGDTSFGNTNGDYDIYTTIIFWNDGSGHFSISDTAQLKLAGVNSWYTCRALSNDWGNDGADDLMLWACSEGYTYGQVTVKLPQLCLWEGRRGQRWGQNGVSRIPEWSWWTPPAFNTVADVAIDQDGDGHLDVALMLNMGGSAGTARVTVLYGTTGSLPDTTNLETITLDGASGRNARFSDITGDGMTELLVDCGSLEVTKVYAGRRGQRLREQYGSGNDAPQEGKGWWRRPWAEIWSAHKLDDGWSGSGFGAPFAYDGNLDGINDLWRMSVPYLLCYAAGDQLDSLIDGIIDVSDGGYIGYIGDIDGSGANVIAVRHTSLNGVVLYKATSRVPQTGIFRKLPHLPASGVDEATVVDTDAAGLHLHAEPNPADGEVRLRWQGEALSGEATITIRDLLGREVVRWSVAASHQQTAWATEGMVGGAYFVTLSIGERSDTTRVIVR